LTLNRPHQYPRDRKGILRAADEEGKVPMRVPLVPGYAAFTYPNRNSISPDERTADACIATQRTPEALLRPGDLIAQRLVSRHKGAS
jgi:hypothetical protein